ncbi:protein of unknown function [Clostridium beijerinckii]|nr:protein of unknown function [Clostridium beijerinckii]
MNFMKCIYFIILNRNYSFVLFVKIFIMVCGHYKISFNHNT